MKKIILACLALLCWSTACLSGPNISDKALQKECKQTIKRLKKEGWQVYGTMQNLETAVTQYYEKLDACKDEHEVLIGHAVASNENTAKSKASADAKNQLASRESVDVVGGDTHDVANINEGGEVKSKETFTSTTETSVQQRVRIPAPSLSICRKDEKGRVEMQIFYLIKKEN